MDTRPWTSYLRRVTPIARVLFIALLAVFAVTSVVHAAGATSMAVRMAAVDDGAMDGPECEDCDPDGSGETVLACDIVCNAPVFASLDQETAFGPRVATSHAAPVFYSFAGRTGPPDPYPPRNII